jgi:hypothetical protein
MERNPRSYPFRLNWLLLLPPAPSALPPREKRKRESGGSYRILKPWLMGIRRVYSGVSRSVRMSLNNTSILQTILNFSLSLSSLCSRFSFAYVSMRKNESQPTRVMIMGSSNNIHFTYCTQRTDRAVYNRLRQNRGQTRYCRIEVWPVEPM